MKKANPYQRIILNALGTRPIMFNPDLARMLGSVTAGLFFNQLLYWWGKGRKPGMIYKTVKEFEEEIALTKHQQLHAQKICIRSGILKVVLKGIPPKRHFIIEEEKLVKMFEAESAKREKNVAGKCPKSEQSKVGLGVKFTPEGQPNITDSTFLDFLQI